LAIQTGKIDFIRIGVNINESEKANEYIRYIKSKGLIVAANFMKSYAVDAEEFATRVKKASLEGADYVYLVDSAGGMFPNDVKKYIEKAKKVSKCEIGFHGHNNLSLAIANSLSAIEAGATIIDTSLQGLGRDGGNASTEILISILIKQGIFKEQNINALLDYSESNILPLLRNNGVKSTPLISGIGFFHSSFYKNIKSMSDDNNVDSREVIIELSKINIIEPSNKDISKAIDTIKNKDVIQSVPTFLNVRKSFTQKTKNNSQKLKTILNELISVSKKQNKKSVFNVVITNSDDIFISNYIQSSANYFIANAQVNSFEFLSKLVHEIEGKVDIILYDIEYKSEDSTKMKQFMFDYVKKSSLFLYNDSEIWAKAIENIILIKSHKSTVTIYLNEKSKLGQKIYSSLEPLNLNICNTLTTDKFDFIVGLKKYEIDETFIKFMSKDTFLIDAGIGSITRDVIEHCMNNSILVIRVDMRVALEAEILQKEKSIELIKNIMGKKEIASINIIAGGIYGKYGDIIVDSISKPSCVIGISNGDGTVKYDLDKEEIDIVNKLESNFKVN
jgi:4-hydroxy-2-oxovalerate aldolase